MISTADLMRLKTQGLSHGQIAARVGLTRQAVGYRLKPRNRRSVPTYTLVARQPTAAPERCVDGCGRLVGRANDARGLGAILTEPDNCRYCARPLTADAEQRAPLDGFIALANGSARRETAAHAAVYGGEE